MVSVGRQGVPWGWCHSSQEQGSQSIFLFVVLVVVAAGVLVLGNCVPFGLWRQSQGQSHSIIRQFHLVPCHFPRPVPFHHPAVSLGALPFPKTCPIPSTIAVISCKLPLLLQGNVDVLCCFCVDAVVVFFGPEALKKVPFQNIHWCQH